jgi:hypothetical protein
MTESSGEPASFDLVAAALRADAADVDTLVTVLLTTLGDTLPAELVSVERSRSLGDRLAGRDGQVVGLTIAGPDLRLSLRRGRHPGASATAEVQRIVKGVVISRREVGLDEWVDTLALTLTELAQHSSTAREALTRLLRG